MGLNNIFSFRKTLIKGLDNISLKLKKQREDKNPPILFVTMPKSGSTYIWHSLSVGLQKGQQRIAG